MSRRSHTRQPEPRRADRGAARAAKDEIITFKADASLVEAMSGIANRSDFIRAAVLAALESTCPLCQGTGILTPNQQEHWEAFASHHSIRECSDCAEPYLTCSKSRSHNAHAHHLS